MTTTIARLETNAQREAEIWGWGWNEKGKMLSLKEREEVGRKKALSG